MGVLTNSPTIGVKALRAADWHLALATSLTGVGLIVSLFLGVWMARRPKMPFVLLPGFLSCALCMGMAVAPVPLWFMFLFGASNLFEIITRPAITAVIRANYPVEARGLVTGKLRQWSAGTFLVGAFAAARLLDVADNWGIIQFVVAMSAGVQALAYVAFSRIRVHPDADLDAQQLVEDYRGPMRAASSTLKRDSRFQRYLLGCFLFGASGMAYEPIIRSYFSHELGLDYTLCVALADVLPSLLQAVTVGHMGAWLDRINPLLAWTVIRAAWALDPLLLAAAPAWPRAALAIATAARLSRGSVMGASWILSWQLGTNYFARRRSLTTVYMGAFLSVTGVQRIVGPYLGVTIGALMSRRAVLAIAGVTGMISSVLAWRQAEAERVEGRYPTFADQELPEPTPRREPVMSP